MKKTALEWVDELPDEQFWQAVGNMMMREAELEDWYGEKAEGTYRLLSERESLLEAISSSFFLGIYISRPEVLEKHLQETSCAK